MKLHAKALGYAAGIVSALIMLLLTIFNSLGIYTIAVSAMQEMHLFYSPTIIGTLTGMIEVSIMSFIAFYLFAVTYNKLA